MQLETESQAFTDLPTALATDVICQPPEQSVFDAGDDELMLVARYPEQMQQCQAALQKWIVTKLEAVSGEVEDLNVNVAIARKQNWGMSALIRAERAARKRLEFYTKIKMALDAGYSIVPNFPVQMIAIRTGKSIDRKSCSGWPVPDLLRQHAQQLPVGEGEYKNPNPIAFSETVDGELVYTAECWNDLEFPFSTAKPQVLSATALAMADKLFDEIGVLPGKKKKEDPIVVGTIIYPRSDKYTPRKVTFMVAWFLDTKTL